MRTLILYIFILFGLLSTVNVQAQLIINSYAHSAGGYDTDAQAFIDAVATLTTAQEIAINDLVVGLKANGTWTKYHAIYPFIGGTASSHKWNLKDPRDLDAAFRLTFVGGITHSSTGFLPNGSTGYAITNFNPNPNLTINNFNLSFYSRTEVDEEAIDIGCENWGYNWSMYMKIRTSNSLKGNGYYNTIGVLSETNTTSLGWFIAQRTDGDTMEAFKNGLSLSSPQTLNSQHGSMWSSMTFPIYIGARNTHYYGVDLFSTKECAFATIGDALTSTEAANDYTVIQAYQTALSRQI